MADLKIILTVVDKATGQVKTVRRSLKDLADGTDAPAKGLNGLTASLGKVAVAAAGAFVAFRALEKIKDFVGGGIEMASALNETINKTKVVFEESSGAILEWSRNSVTAMGQTRNEALSAAASYGNLFTTMGLSEQAAGDMSMRLVELASDLASFHNIATSDALDKLRSGLVGEAEPMRQLGVLLNETAVKAKAAQMGFAAVDGQLSESAKVQARYALILEQTTKAQGDFARTSGDQANAARIAGAAWEEIQTALGQRLLPVVRDVTVALAKTLPQALKDLEGPFDAAGRAAQSFADLLRDVAKAAQDTGTAIDQILVPPLRGISTAAEKAGISLNIPIPFLSDIRKYGDAAQVAMDALGDAMNYIADRKPNSLFAWVRNFYDTERAAMEAERAVEGADKSLEDLARKATSNSALFIDPWRTAFHAIGDEAERAAARAVAAMDAAARAARAAADLATMQAIDDYDTREGMRAQREDMVRYTEDQDRAAAALERTFRSVGSAASSAADEAARALEEGIARSAEAAAQAVSGLRRALDNVLQSPLLGSQRISRGIEDLQDEIAKAEYRAAQMRADKAPRSELRAELKRQVGLRRELDLLELEGRATLTPAERQVDRALNPLLPEMTVEEKIAAGLALQGQVAAAESVETQYNTTTNHISITVDAGGRATVSGETQEGQWIAEQFAAFAQQLFGDAGSGTRVSASPAVAGAR